MGYRRFGRDLARQIGSADELQEVAITHFVLRQQYDPIRFDPAALRPAFLRHTVARESDLAANDRLNTRRGAGGSDFERAEQIAGIGDRYSRHALGMTHRDQMLDRDRTGRQRVGGVNAEMNKIGEWHIRNIARAAPDFSRGRYTPYFVVLSRLGSVRVRSRARRIAGSLDQPQ